MKDQVNIKSIKLVKIPGFDTDRNIQLGIHDDYDKEDDYEINDPPNTTIKGIIQNISFMTPISNNEQREDLKQNKIDALYMKLGS